MRRNSRTSSTSGPVLLLGAGRGEATCGVLYLASHLRRNGVEAFVRIHDADETTAEVKRSLGALLDYLRPRLVGISLKWFHHLARARLLARTVKAIAPEVRVVLGGNTASWFWRELEQWDCVDAVVLGDGEVPLLGLCRGDPSPPNTITRESGAWVRPPLRYVQSASSEEVFYSHFPDVFLSKLDQHSFSGWIAPGKGCAERCVYCGGGREAQQAAFGRSAPFLRPAENVQRDLRAIAPHVWQLRYDFAGGTAHFLSRVFDGVDLTRHSSTYFLWGAPPRALVEALSRTFRRVFLVLDIGCFSQTQRRELVSRELLKPCPSDAELLEAVTLCRRHANLELEVCGIAGLPFSSAKAHAEERRLIDRLGELGCVVGYQRLEAQPGAHVTDEAERFGMVAQARSFDELLAWFSRGDAAADAAFPMVRFRDAASERAMRRHVDTVSDGLRQLEEAKRFIPTRSTRLVASVAATQHYPLGEWLGPHRVPAGVARELVTTLRSPDGAGLACAPSVSPKRFSHPALELGLAAEAILAVLDAFAVPARADSVVARVSTDHGLDPRLADDLVAELSRQRFLGPA